MKDEGGKVAAGVASGSHPSSLIPHPSSFLTPRRIYILPTRACVPLGAVLLAIAYAALSQNNAGAYLLGFFLGSLVIVSMVHTHFALTGLRVRVGVIEPAFAGRVARAPVWLENPTRRARPGEFRVSRARAWRWPWEPSPPPEPVGAPGVATTEALVARGETELLLSVPAVRRGRHALGLLSVSTTYPLGFFRGVFYEATAGEFLVYPALAGELPPPNPPAAAAFDLAPGAPSGAGDDYAGTRPYLPGDSQRHVDWRAAARGRGLLVKQFAGSGREPRWLDWRDLDALGSGAAEARLSQLCRWLVELEAAPAANGREFTYGLRLPPGVEIPPSRGEAHLRRCLRELAVWGNDE